MIVTLTLDHLPHSLSLSAHPSLNASMHKLTCPRPVCALLNFVLIITSPPNAELKKPRLCVYNCVLMVLRTLLFHSQFRSGEVSRIKDHSHLKIKVNPTMHKPRLDALCTCKLRADDHISTGLMQI